MPFLESFWAVLYRKRLFFEMSETLTHPTLELAQNHLGFSIGLGDAPPFNLGNIPKPYFLPI